MNERDGCDYRVVSKNSKEANSHGTSIVVAEQATKPQAGTDGADIRKFREFWLDDFVLQTLVVSFGVILQSEFRDGAA